jgi:hypothetical protein
MISGLHFWFALIGLYVLESIRLTPPGTVLFTRRMRARYWSGGFPFGGPGVGRSWTVLPLFPGGDGVIMAQDFVVACDSDRLTANSFLVPGEAHVYLWTDLKAVATEDRDLLINATRFLVCPSAEHARFAAERIESLRATDAPLREHAIRETIRDSFAPGARTHLDRFCDATANVRVLAALLWIVAIPLFGAALLVTGSDAVLLPALVLIECLSMAVGITAIRAKLRLAPAGQRRFPWASLKYFFYPIASLRAPDDLAEGLLPGVHPLRLCIDLCEPERRTPLLRDLFLRVRYPTPVSRLRDTADETSADAVAEWFNAQALAEMEKVIEQNAPEVLKTVIPERSDPACRFWCPRCRTQYRSGKEDCADCPGVKLRAFEAS